jgi:glutamine cyclotransferase
MRVLLVPWIALLWVASGAGCNGSPGANAAPQTTPSPTPLPAASPTPTPRVTVKVLHTYPHDRLAFTQGLVVDQGALVESTGLNGKSTLRRVTLTTGAVVKKVTVPAEYFAEGMTILGNTIYQLTWKGQKGFTYNRETFAKTGEFAYTGEGWGLTTDGTSLILSDGTSTLRFLDPNTFAVTRSVTVTSEGLDVSMLNELEFVQGQVWANVWQTDYIVRIDPKNGNVLAWIDLTGLLPASERTAETDVLNGIAYDSAGNHIYVTGKLWPKLYEVKIVPKP